MIQQFYERLHPAPAQPRPLTLDEQQQLARAARRLQTAVRGYLYHHGSYGTHGVFSDKPNHDAKKCRACTELQAALDDA